MEKPNVFLFGNYRSYLAEITNYLRSEKDLSIRQLAKALDIKGHTYLKAIVSGKRSLQPQLARRLAKIAELSPSQTKFFLILIRFNETEDLEEKNECFEALSVMARNELISPHRLSVFEIYKDWRNIAVLEALAPRPMPFRLRAVASGLGLRPPAVEAILKQLEIAGLAKRTGKNWCRTEAEIRTPEEVTSLFVRNFHFEMTKLGLEKIASLATEKRELAGLTLPLSQKDFQSLRQKIRKFAEECQKNYSGKSESENVFHMQILLYPLLEFDGVAKEETKE